MLNFNMLNFLYYLKNLGLTLFLILSIVTQGYCLDSDKQFWTIVNVTGNLTEDEQFKYFFELQPRLGDDFSKLERLILHGALGYQLLPKTYFWLGYGWTPSYLDSSYESNFNNENRIWQQITHNHKNDFFSFNHRFRLEQRLIDNQPEVSNRVRYLFKLSRPFFTADQKIIGLTWYDELFFNINSANPGAKAGFDRNRTFIGSYAIIQNVRYEFGFLNEYSVRRNNEDRMVNALVLSINFSL